jgi:hypothetical protein
VSLLTARCPQLKSHLQVGSEMSRSRRLITLSTLSGLLAQAEAIEDIFPTAIEIVADVMEIEVVLIYKLDDRRKELALSA